MENASVGFYAAGGVPMMDSEELLHGGPVDGAGLRRRPWGRWSRVILFTATAVLAAVVVASLPGRRMSGLVQKSSGDLIVMADDDANDPCIQYPWLKFLEIKHNNLGGKGPQGAPEGMVYKAREMATGRMVDVHLNAISEYSPFSSRMNGFSGKYGSINIKSGSHVDIKMSIFEPGTMTPVVLDNSALTFFDLDKHHGSECIEYLTMEDYKDVIMEPNTEIEQTDLGSGKAKFSATQYGDGDDNPTDPLHLDQKQKNKAVSFLFDQLSVKVFTIGASPGPIPRFFMFIGRPSLMCAITEQDKLAPTTPAPDLPKIPKIVPEGPKEEPVNADPGQSLLKFYKKVGDPVKAGDTIASVRDPKTGGIQLIKAPKSGTIVKQQDPLKPGEVIDQRIEDEDTCIVIIETPDKLPPLPVGDKEMPTNTPDGCVLKEWKVKEGDVVKAGDPIAVCTLPDGREQVVKSPQDGKVVDTQPIVPGDSVDDRMEDQDIAVVHRPDKWQPIDPEGQETAISTDPDAIFVEWHKDVGDPVKKGDPLCTIKHPNGTEEVLKAPTDGYVVSEQPLEPGDVITDKILSGTNVAVIAPKKKTAPLPVQDDEEPVKTPTEDDVIFKEWKVETLDRVKKGDPIAVVQYPNGTEETIYAPRDGVVKSRQPIKNGEVIKDTIPDDTIAVIADEQKMKEPPLPIDDSRGEQPVEDEVPEEAEFVEWYVDKGDQVNAGDPIAKVKLPDGTEKIIKAPIKGTVTQKQPLLPGDQLDQEMMPDDRNIAVIRPPFTPPPLETAPGDEPVKGPEEPGAVFKEWLKEPGEAVKQGDPIAKVEMPDGTIQTIEAPKSGVVKDRQPLKPGDPLDTRVPDKNLATIDTNLLPPLDTSGPRDEPAKIPKGFEFVEWKKNVGDPVKKGDPIATVKTPDGTIVPILAPEDGTVKSREPLQPGDSLDGVPDDTIAVIEKPDGSEAPVESPPGWTFNEWKKDVGDEVKEGDVIATVKDPAGNIVPVKAFADGTITSEDPLQPGDPLLGKPSQIAVIERPEGGPVAVETPNGYTFNEWEKDVGDPVKKGDVIATVKDPAGNILPIKAPKDGVVKSKQPLLPGDPIIGKMPDENIAVIEKPEPAPPMPLESGEEPVKTPDTPTTFKEWLKEPGDKVKKGDPIATVQHPNGTVEEILAPEDGVVKSRQPLKPGDDVSDNVPDDTIAVIDPFPQDPLPVEGEDTGVKPDTPGAVFEEWKVEPGDEVKKGDPIATVKNPDGTTETIFAPEDGTVKSRQPLEPGDPLDDVLPEDGNIAVITPDKLPPLPYEDTDPPPDPVKLPEDKEGMTFKEWKVDIGDTVKKGDVIATVTKPGETDPIPIVATKDGIVEHKEPLEPGDPLDNVPDDTIAKLGDPPTQSAPVAPEGTTLKEWKVDEGTPVKKGDPIAVVVDPNGVETVITAPEDGVMKTKKPINPGDPMDDQDPEIAVVEKEVVEPIKPPEEGLKFHQWLTDEGAEVKEGDPIANVKDGTGKIITIFAPKDGTVKWKAPLEPEDPLDEVPGQTIVELVNHEDAPVVKPSKEGEFEEWLVDVGDEVKKGDPIAVVKEPNGQLTTITAPRDGVVSSKEPLNAGDPLSNVPEDGGIAEISSTAEKTLDVPPETRDGGEFVEWKKDVGDPVKAGDVIAVVKDKDGNPHEIKAPKDGFVKSRQPLKPGDSIDRLEEPLEKNNIAVIGPRPQLAPLPVDETLGQEDVEVPPGAEFKEWHVKPGDKVAAGDPVCTVIDENNVEKVIRAPIPGNVLSVQPLKPGDPLDYRLEEPLEDNNLAVIGEPLPPLPVEPWQKGVPTDDGLVFKHYNTEPGKPVTDEDPLIVARTPDGDVVEATPDTNGTNAWTQPIAPGAPIDGAVEDGPLAVVEPTKLPKIVCEPGQIPVSSGEGNNGAGNAVDLAGEDGPGDVFEEFSVPDGTKVREGDPIAKVGYYRPGTETPADPTTMEGTLAEQDGPKGYFIEGGVGEPPLKRTIYAEADGVVKKQQALTKQDAINRRMEDKTIAVIDPRAPELDHSLDWQLPAFAPPDSIFKEWNVQVGDKVKEGDSLALVLLQPDAPDTVERRRRLKASARRRLKEDINFEGAEEKQILSPADGCVMSRAPFLPFDIIGASILGDSIAVIAPCDGCGWICWLPLLIFLCCCCCICFALLFAKRKPDEPPPPPVVVPPPPKPKRRAPPGVRFDFDDENGMCHTYYFDYHPLGIIYSKTAPVKVDGFKFNAYAKHKGVKEGWIVKRVHDVEVRDSHDLEEVKNKVKEYLKQYPCWPLRLEFKESAEPFFMPERPIGLEFERGKTPIRIKQVYPNSNAEQKGIQPNWEITKIGEVGVENADYNTIMHNFRDGVDQLDRRIDGNAVGWSNNASAEPLPVEF